MAHSLDSLIELSNNRSISVAKAIGEPISPIGMMQLNCPSHGVFFSTGKRLLRREVWSACPACVDEARRAEAASRLAEATRIARVEHENRLASASVPARFIGRTLENFRAETPDQARALGIAREYVAQWDQTYRKGLWLVFSGLPGTGKSHLAIAILQAIMPKHVGRYMTCMELIQTLRSTWRKDSESSEVDLLDALSALPLLVLDEIGVQYGTDSEQTHLFDVLDRRYRDMRPTILLTNQNKDGFKTFVGDRVYDRMTEVARWVPFAWPSYRPVARREIQE